MFTQQQEHLGAVQSLWISSSWEKTGFRFLVFTTGCWAGTGNVGLTGAPGVFQAEICHWECLWGTPKMPTSLGPPWPVLSCDRAGDTHGTTAAFQLTCSLTSWGSPPLGSQHAFFFLADISLGRFWVFNKPIFKIKNLFLEFCFTFFCSF